MTSNSDADDSSDDVWIRTAGGEMSIRMRSLTQYLKKGGSVVHARLLEGLDGSYSVWVSLADRPGEFRVNQFHADAPKTFKDVGLAIASIRKDCSYLGAIILVTDCRPVKTTP